MNLINSFSYVSFDSFSFPKLELLKLCRGDKVNYVTNMHMC